MIVDFRHEPPGHGGAGRVCVGIHAHKSTRSLDRICNGRGEEEGQGVAGPSDYMRRAWVEGMEKWTGEDGSGCEAQAVEEHQPAHTRQSRTASRRPRRLAPTLSLIPALLPFTPSTFAAPPASRRSSPSKTLPLPTVTVVPKKRDGVQYITSAEPPTAMPTEVLTVQETALPYLYSPGPDGQWTQVTDGWKIYGRQSPTTDNAQPNDPEVTRSANWAVEQALPPGWGQQSTRTDFYRVPLIACAAVILAVCIVVWIIITAFKRRKAHRRQKRRAERLRRKAMAAAGLTEEDVKDEAAKRALEEKLDELQRQRRMKKGTVKSADSRAKVNVWTAGLRRRRTARPVSKPPSIVAVEPKPEEPERDSQDTDRTTPTVPSSLTHEEGGMPSREHTTTEESTDSRGHSNLTSFNDSPGDRTSGTGSGSSARPTETTFFPPAYRPASVRSLPAASSSRTPAPEPSPQVEKTRAPGYYPAPSTADGEVALAVASRSEGKQRVVPDADITPDETERVRHIATDDKNVLERLRLASSAPPTRPEGGDGPSAPHIETDEYGFETMPLQVDDDGAGPSLARPAANHPDLPAPPRPSMRRTFSGEVEREVHEQLDELNLLPSAPPRAVRSPVPSAPFVSSAPFAPSAPSTPVIGSEPIEAFAIPSAPPLLEEEDEEGVATDLASGDEASAEVVPSAPPTPAVEQEQVLAPPAPIESSSTAAGQEQGQGDRRESEAPSLGEGRFLPRYEP